MSKNTKDTTVDIDYADQAVPKEGRKGFLTMFMIMLGFTFFSASMWVGQQMAAGLDFWGFIKSLLLGGAILGVYTGLLGYVGAKTGLSMDLLAKRAFGEKGSYLSSAMISFTQIGWFGVGVAMFAIPVSGELLGGSKAAMWALVLVAGGCIYSGTGVCGGRQRDEGHRILAADRGVSICQDQQDEVHRPGHGLRHYGAGAAGRYLLQSVGRDNRA